MDVPKEVRKAQKGNIQAFENLIQAHKVVMYQVAKTMLTQDVDCKDAMQESILKAFEKIKTLRNPVFFKTWLLRIVINECNLIHRQNRKVTELGDFAVPPTYENGFEQIELEQLLEMLPREDRQILELYHINDISIKDLAEIYQKSENTIKTRLRRARENARNILGKQEGYAWKKWEHQLKEQVNRPIPENMDIFMIQTLNELTTKHKHKKSCRRLFYTSTTIAASLAFTVGMASLSPAFADAVKSIPIIGSVFELIGVD